RARHAESAVDNHGKSPRDSCEGHAGRGEAGIVRRRNHSAADQGACSKAEKIGGARRCSPAPAAIERSCEAPHVRDGEIENNERREEADDIGGRIAQETDHEREDGEGDTETRDRDHSSPAYVKNGGGRGTNKPDQRSDSHCITDRARTESCAPTQGREER